VTGLPAEIFLPAALARLPRPTVRDAIEGGPPRTVDHVDHPAGDDYLIYWADGGVTAAGARHPFRLERQ
jgi:hypothetical protein